MDEEEVKKSIAKYKEQLSALDNIFIKENVDYEELKEMQLALIDIIKLQEESLIALKKSKLLSLVEDYLAPPIVEQKFVDVEEKEYKYRVLYSEYVQPKYHDVIVLEEDFDQLDNQAKVLFTHPVVESMRPCPYFMKDSCCNKQCKFSHGFSISKSLLLPYKEPNYDNIVPGMVCLVRNVDTDLWFLASIEFIEFESQKVIVKSILSNQDPLEVDIPLIRPLDDEINHDEANMISSREIMNQNTTNLHLLNPNPDSFAQTPSPNLGPEALLGDWEAHTKGIGSRLLQKMGFTEGQGLGKYNQGITEPVKAHVGNRSNKTLGLGKGSRSLNPGSSSRQKSTAATDIFPGNSGGGIAASQGTTPSLFAFINTSLNTSLKADNEHSGNKVKSSPKLSEKELRIMEIKLDKDIQQCKKDIGSIKGNMQRHSQDSVKSTSTSNNGIYTHYEHKLKTATVELQRLEAKAQKLKRAQDQKDERKRLRIF